MENITIQLVHGRTKHMVEINPMLPLRSLMVKVEELTGIPQSGQKLICQGQTLTSQDPDSTYLHLHKLMNGSKVMVLGRKVNPENDAAYQKIVDIEKRTLDITQKFIEITNQVQDIENGHLPKIHQEQALKDLEKRSKSCSEAWMKILESLDSIQLEESQTLARSKRKSIVNSTNANMDGADEIIHRIKNLRDKATVN